MNQLSNFIIVGADTDGLAFKKPDEKPFTSEERAGLLNALNAEMDELIRWEDDGVFLRQIVIKTKNYILQDENGKIKIKGSALKATTKEKALQRFIKDLIELLLKDKKDQVLALYFSYVREILNLKDISDWCMKKTVTKSVLNPERTQEARVFEALKDSEFNEGDKVYMFNRTDTDLCLKENFDGTYDVDTLLGKLYDTLCVFKTIIDVSVIPDLTLKRNKHYLDMFVHESKTMIGMGLASAIANIGVSKNETKKGVFPSGFFQTRTS